MGESNSSREARLLGLTLRLNSQGVGVSGWVETGYPCWAHPSKRRALRETSPRPRYSSVQAISAPRRPSASVVDQGALRFVHASFAEDCAQRLVGEQCAPFVKKTL